MGSRLIVEVKETDKVSYVRLSGVVDEDNDLGELVSRITTKPSVVINTADIDRINSCGVRDWVTWLKTVHEKGTVPWLIECSPAIMTQVNLVNNFVGAGTILSFYAPYFCSACETDKMLLIDVEQALATTPFRAPICRCDQCDHQMEFDDIETSYFAFLGHTQRRRVESSVLESIRRFSSERDSRLRARSSSIAIATTGPGPHTQSSVVSPLTPDSSLKGLLTESVTFTPAKSAAVPAAPNNKLLFVILGLLVTAIGLLAYVIFRSA